MSTTLRNKWGSINKVVSVTDYCLDSSKEGLLKKATKHHGENQPVGANKVIKPEIKATIAKI